ncbi:MAG: hypothetical protein IT210_03930 [Armatimonadetes bacterium]|nr:hypothetical protein [Armatimonadota bacterium]
MLENQFSQEAMEVCRLLSRQYHYTPTRYLELARQYGSVTAVKMLLRTGEDGIQEGLIRLWELGRLDLSLEAMVLQEKYALLFADAERQIARGRLSRLNYSVAQ